MVEATAHFSSQSSVLSTQTALSERVDCGQLIAAHRAISGLEHALQFSPSIASNTFCEIVWLLDGLGAMQLDGEPIWLQTVIDEPNNAAVQRAITHTSIASRLANSHRPAVLTQLMAMQISNQLSGEIANKKRSLRDAYSNDSLAHGLAHWEHFVSDRAGVEDSLVICALADAKLRRLSPFSSNNSATAGLLFNLSLRNEQILQATPLCLSNYFSRHAQQFTQALTHDDSVIRFYLTGFTELALDLLSCLARLVDHLEHCQQVVSDTLSRAPAQSVMRAICRPVCTNIDLVEYGITRRQTSATYLKKLSDAGLLESCRQGKELRYMNRGVVEAFHSLI